MDNKRVLFITITFLCTFAQSSTVEDDGSFYRTTSNGYIPGPLPYIHLKRAGFDLSKALRQKESPPPPPPTPACEPERTALAAACERVDTAADVFTRACAVLDDLVASRRDQRAELRAVIARIAELRASLRGTGRAVTDTRVVRENLGVVQRQGKPPATTPASAGVIRRELRALLARRSALRKLLRSFRTTIPAARRQKQIARVALRAARAAKRAAQRALSLCLKSS